MTDSFQDVGAVSELFHALTPTSADVPTTSVYEMLSEALREDDQDSAIGGTALLERFVSRFEELRDRMAQKVHRIPYLKRYDLTPDVVVDYLLQHVGFGNGTAYEVARVLSVDLKRRLVKAAIPFWKRRGTLPGLYDSLLFVTGYRPIIDTWFDFRLVTGETPFGGFLPPPASASSICLPPVDSLYDPAGSIGSGSSLPPPEDLGEYESRVFVRSRGGDVQDELVYDICSLARPVDECIQIVYGLYGEQFLDGLTGAWGSLEAPRPTWVPPNSLGTTGTARLPGLRFSSGISREALVVDGSEAWQDYLVRAWIRPAGADPLRITTFYLHSSQSATRASGVGASINWTDKTIQAVSKTALDLNDTPGSTTAVVDLVSGVTVAYCLEVQVRTVDSTYSRVRVYFDHALVVDDTIEHFGQTEGPLEVYSNEQDHWDLVRLEIESLDSTIRRLYPPAYDD